MTINFLKVNEILFCMYLQNPLISLKLFKYVNNFFWLLTWETSEISYVIVPCSTRKMLLMESAITEFPKMVNTRVGHSLFFVKYK